VLLTGFAERFLRGEHGEDGGPVFILGKPFRDVELAAMVSQALRCGRDQAGAPARTVPRSGSAPTSS
jgi:hypothetical protein